MAGYDGRGVRAPLTIVRNSDVVIQGTITSGGVPVNLASATIAGEIYAPGSTSPTVTFTAVVSGSSFNVLTLLLSEAQTSTLLPLSRYDWTLWVTIGSDRQAWRAGVVNVVDGRSGKAA